MPLLMINQQWQDSQGAPMVPHSKGTNTGPLLISKEESQTTEQEGDAAISRKFPTRGKLVSPSLDDSFLLNDILTSWSIEMQPKLKWRNGEMVHANSLVGSTVLTVPSTLSSKSISNGRSLDDSQKVSRPTQRSAKRAQVPQELSHSECLQTVWMYTIQDDSTCESCSKGAPGQSSVVLHHPRAQVHGQVEIDVPTIESSKTEQHVFLTHIHGLESDLH